MASTDLIRGLREQIADRLRDDILSGRLDDGARLSEIKLAKQFGVSRGPIREALVQLTHEGLLIAKPNCGVKVAPSAPESIRDLIVPIRRTIETYALRSFFDDINDEDFRIWEGILNRLQLACRRKDHAATSEQDIAFHRSIIRRAGQPDLIALWSIMVARIRSHFRLTHLQYKELMDLYKEHEAIIETFRTKNKEASVKALENNIGTPWFDLKG